MIAFVALGSNVGDSRAIVMRAMDQLGKLSRVPLKRSSLWETEPVDCPPNSAPFINAMVALEPLPAETPETLLKKLKTLEVEFGRKPKTILNEARPLDLDLIAFGNEVRNGPELILPHPRAHERRFVLAPWSEIAPDYVMPHQKLSVEKLLTRLGVGHTARRLS
ncbi:MAG TPA: 2-amino-4-hydroxy-6-hydroxymethyldihydropteridine diphosphokinase [Verrucomicrobiae bacterium]|nr:2-amino-4-hydroxy-6-hydroxymethyldihydropteridine diphosphokinase [Verrucomicrobiae bacterium]